MNLSQNAVNHTGESDAVELGSAIANGSMSLWVRDTGPGVADDDRERIFERFARGSGTRSGRMAAASGSPSLRRLRRRTTAGSSSTAPRATGARFTVVDPNPALQGGGRPLNRILIAEDEPRLASFLEKGLRANGFVTTVVADGMSRLDDGARRRVRPARPRPRPARPGRHGRVARAARGGPAHAGRDPHRARRCERQGRGARGRRGRLRDEAVPLRGAAGARAGAAARRAHAWSRPCCGRAT